MKASKIAIACLFLFILSFSGKVSGQTSVGLWAYYPFNANGQDSSGNGRHISNPTLTPDKNNNLKAALFNSNGSGLSASTVTPPISNSSFSVGFWFYVEDDASRGGYYQGNYSGSPYNRVILGKFGNGTIYAQIIDDNGTTISLTTAQDLNTWVHYNLTYDKDTKTLTFYKNGSQVNQNSNSSFNNSFGESTYPGFSLAVNPVNGVSMNGKIDEVRIYSRALTSSEVTEIYNSMTAYTITSSVNNGSMGSISPTGSVQVTSGSNKQFTATATTGNQFDYFIVDGNTSNHITTNPYTLTNVTANGSITANFSQIPIQTYNVTATVDDTSKGSISPSGISTVNTGTNKQFTATPKAGYLFDYFSVDNNMTNLYADNPYTLTNITSDHSIKAYFKVAPPATVTVTASVDTTQGHISPAGISTVNYAGNIQYTATPNSNYEFDGFVIDNNTITKIGTNPYTLTNVTSNKTIEATFKQISFFTITPTVNDSSKGTISPNVAQTVQSGSNVQFTATPKPTYQFDYFLVDGTQIITTNPYTITNVHANITVQAVFKLVGMLSAKLAPDGVGTDLFQNEGALGIGTLKSVAGYKLVVAGKVLTEEVEVKLSQDWPDYVFETHYELTSLEKLENYIKENKHLPEIPSESEVAEKGISLGEMQGKLLKKIEELTLYIIEMKKENKELRKQFDLIKK